MKLSAGLLFVLSAAMMAQAPAGRGGAAPPVDTLLSPEVHPDPPSPSGCAPPKLPR